jgi:hypothetical protein
MMAGKMPALREVLLGTLALTQKSGSAKTRPENARFPREIRPLGLDRFFERGELPRKPPKYPLEKVGQSSKTTRKRAFSRSGIQGEGK